MVAKSSPRKNRNSTAHRNKPIQHTTFATIGKNSNAQKPPRGSRRKALRRPKKGASGAPERHSAPLAALRYRPPCSLGRQRVEPHRQSRKGGDRLLSLRPLGLELGGVLGVARPMAKTSLIEPFSSRSLTTF
jgi:hypothetical protein